MENENKKVVDISEMRKRQKTLRKTERKKTKKSSGNGGDQQSFKNKAIIWVQFLLFVGIIAYIMQTCGGH